MPASVLVPPLSLPCDPHSAAWTSSEYSECCPEQRDRPRSVFPNDSPSLSGLFRQGSLLVGLFASSSLMFF